MARIASAVLAGMLGGALATSIGQAQAVVYAGGGASFPVGTYGDIAKTGWLAVGGFTVPVGPKGLQVGGEVLFGSNKHSGVLAGKSNLFGGYGTVEYRVGNPEKPGVYFFGQAGALDHEFKPAGSAGGSGSDWKFSAGVGLGVDIPVGRVSIFGEARYMTRSDTDFIPILAGIAIPFGRTR